MPTCPPSLGEGGGFGGPIAPPGGDFGGPTLEDRVKDVRTRKTEAMTRGDRKTAERLDEEERGLWGRIAGDK